MKRIALLLLTGLAVVLSAGTALGTPGSGVSASTLGKATIDGKLKMRSEGLAEAIVRQVTIAPGGYTGWHTHPGPAVVIVTSGFLTLYDGDDTSCVGRVYGPGQGFVDPGYGHVHIARNETGGLNQPAAQPAQFIVTFLDVPVGRLATLDADDPGNCVF
jgi:hypothetical protein